MAYVERNDHVPGYVYLIEAIGSDGLFKIGLTRDLERRIRELNGSQSPFKLRYIKAIQVQDMATVEANLHREFKAYATTKNEWFRFDQRTVGAVVAAMGGQPETTTPTYTPRWGWVLGVALSIFGTIAVAYFVASHRQQGCEPDTVGVERICH